MDSSNIGKFRESLQQQTQPQPIPHKLMMTNPISSGEKSGYLSSIYNTSSEFGDKPVLTEGMGKQLLSAHSLSYGGMPSERLPTIDQSDFTHIPRNPIVNSELLLKNKHQNRGPFLISRLEDPEKRKIQVIPEVNPNLGVDHLNHPIQEEFIEETKRKREEKESEEKTEEEKQSKKRRLLWGALGLLPFLGGFGGRPANVPDEQNENDDEKSIEIKDEEGDVNLVRDYAAEADHKNEADEQDRLLIANGAELVADRVRQYGNVLQLEDGRGLEVVNNLAISGNQPLNLFWEPRREFNQFFTPVVNLNFTPIYNELIERWERNQYIPAIEPVERGIDVQNVMLDEVKNSIDNVTELNNMVSDEPIFKNVAMLNKIKTPQATTGLHSYIYNFPAEKKAQIKFIFDQFSEIVGKEIPVPENEFVATHEVLRILKLCETISGIENGGYAQKKFLENGKNEGDVKDFLDNFTEDEMLRIQVLGKYKTYVNPTYDGLNTAIEIGQKYLSLRQMNNCTEKDYQHLEGELTSYLAAFASSKTDDKYSSYEEIEDALKPVGDILQKFGVNYAIRDHGNFIRFHAIIEKTKKTLEIKPEESKTSSTEKTFDTKAFYINLLKLSSQLNGQFAQIAEMGAPLGGALLTATGSAIQALSEGIPSSLESSFSTLALASEANFNFGVQGESILRPGDIIPPIYYETPKFEISEIEQLQEAKEIELSDVQEAFLSTCKEVYETIPSDEAKSEITTFVGNWFMKEFPDYKDKLPSLMEISVAGICSPLSGDDANHEMCKRYTEFGIYGAAGLLTASGPQGQAFVGMVTVMNRLWEIFRSVPANIKDKMVEFTTAPTPENDLYQASLNSLNVARASTTIR